MIKELRRKSNISYIMIVLVLCLVFASTIIFVDREKSSADLLNIASKQRVYSQGLVFFCYKYHDSSYSEVYKNKILKLIDKMRKGNIFIKGIDSDEIDQVMHSSKYNFEQQFEMFLDNAEHYVNTKESKYLNTVNLLYEAILNESDMIVDILEKNFKKFIFEFQIYLSVSLIILLMLIILIYRKIILKSIASTEELYNKLNKSQENLLQTQKISKLISWNLDVKSGEISLSKLSEDIFGLPLRDKFNLNTFCEIIYEKDLNRVLELFDGAMNFGIPFQTEFRSNESGELKVFDIYCEIRSENNKIIELYGLIQDITEKANLRDKMKLYLEKIDKNIIASSTDKRGVITYVSEAFSEISGYKKEELLGNKHSMVRHPDTPKEFFVDLWSTISSGKTWEGELKNLKKDGGYYWVDVAISPDFDFKGNIIGYTAVRQDITDKKQVEYLSITDGLTNLYNRRYFNDISQKEIDRAKRDKHIFAFVLLDIDNFKKYNDTYGHQDGDAVLVSVSESLKNTFKRSSDIVFRLGGEEFGVIINSDSIDKISPMVEQARENLQNLNIEHKENLPSKVVTASFGLIVVEVVGEAKYDIEDIYKQADMMLYEAKESGRNRVCIKRV